MKIIEAGEKEKKLWSSFVLMNKGEFLQSWEWGDFQELTGSPSTSLGAGKIWRLAAQDDDGEILGAALIIRHELPLGKNYLYCPRGPVFKNPKSKIQIPKVVDLFLGKAKEIALKENSVFFRIESSKEIYLEVEPPSTLGGSTSKYSKYPAPNLQPQNTLILDITKPEEQLLAEMKQKTRYNIKLAEKRGVKIRMSDKNTLKTDFEKFWFLTEETAMRDKIKTHPKEYYKKMLGVLPFAKSFLAEYEGRVLAANIVLFFDSRAIYLHGASSGKNRNLMAPYLLQWEQIKNARESGFREYDFWGIAESQISNLKPQKFLESDHKPNWEGITRFKKGFGGKEANYPEAVDFVFQPIIYGTIRVVRQAARFLKR